MSFWDKTASGNETLIYESKTKGDNREPEISMAENALHCVW